MRETIRLRGAGSLYIEFLEYLNREDEIVALEDRARDQTPGHLLGDSAYGMEEYAGVNEYRHGNECRLATADLRRGSGQWRSVFRSGDV